MAEIVEQDEQREKKCRARRDLAAEEQQENSRNQLAEAEAPDELRRNFSRRNRTFRAALAVEIRVEGVVQKHSAGVEQTDAEK